MPIDKPKQPTFQELNSEIHKQLGNFVQNVIERLQDTHPTRHELETILLALQTAKYTLSDLDKGLWTKKGGFNTHVAGAHPVTFTLDEVAEWYAETLPNREGVGVNGRA